MLAQRLDRDPAAARSALARAREHLAHGLDELQDLARGIHPAVLTERGLEAAIAGLVQRAPVPVELEIDVPERPDAGGRRLLRGLRALTNVARYAEARRSALTSDPPVTRCT